MALTRGYEAWKNSDAEQIPCNLQVTGRPGGSQTR